MKTETQPQIHTEVKREGNNLWLEGVQGWIPGDYSNSVHAAEARIMQALGEDITYEYMMGVSGTAFRMQVHERGCPSSPHSFCGYQTIQGAVEALPWHVVPYECKTEEADSRKKTRAAVMASIDKGVPCQYGNEEDGIIIGYQEDGEEWICLHPYQFNTDPFVETKWPWGVGVFTSRKDQQPDRKACVRKSLELALKMDSTKHKGDYRCGQEAWNYWIATLEDDARFAPNLEESKQFSQHGNFWIFESLIDARKAAAIYLRDVARDFPGDAQGHLTSAAENYEEMVEVLSPRPTWEIAPPPWDTESVKAWTGAMRHEQARLLRQALTLECQALGEIKRALAAM